MHVLQLAKRSVLTVVAMCAALTGCGDSGPEVPFNPAGTTADLEAVNSTFGSPTFASFSSLGLMFDAALGSAPLISASVAALDTKGKGAAGMRAAAARSAERLKALAPKGGAGLNALAMAVPAEIAGKTFVWSGGGYVVSDLTGAPSNGVRFILYAVDPVTQVPVEPLVQTGHVDLSDLSSGSTSAARVRVYSGETEYINYTVTATNTVSGGRISMLGYITDGTHVANINLRATLTSSAGLTLTYSVDVPTRDFSIDLTLTSTGLDTETATSQVTLEVRGPNGWITMTGQFDQAGGTLNVGVSGDHFATITQSGSAPPVITGDGGQPLTDDEIVALSAIFYITSGAFTSFDHLFAPVGAFMEPAA